MNQFNSLDWTLQARILLDRTETLHENLPAYLMLRHSQREDALGGIVPRNMPITSLGREMAIEFGRNLSNRVDRSTVIYHSPLDRCRQTAEAIQLGIQESGKKAELKGAIEELVTVGGSFERKTQIEVQFYKDYVNYWLLGFFAESDLEPATRYGQRMVQKMIDVQPPIQAPLIIMVAHDDTLLALRGVLTGIPVDETWLSFIGGYFIQFLTDHILFSDATRTARLGPYPVWWKNIKLSKKRDCN
jgi:broad specificity phosphatase PhoE